MAFNNTPDMLAEIEDMVHQHIKDNMAKVNPEKIGLDYRCGSLYIDSECIAVAKYNDRTLQYYGGFEYVDSEHRKEMGYYVFYMSESERVNDCIERYYESQVN